MRKTNATLRALLCVAIAFAAGCGGSTSIASPLRLGPTIGEPQYEPTVDIATGDCGTPPPFSFFGEADFRPIRRTSGADDARFVDVDGDGRLDLVSETSEPTVSWGGDNGVEDGFSVLTADLGIPVRSFQESHWGDFDGDGDLDVVLSTTFDPTSNGRFLLNLGNRQFTHSAAGRWTTAIHGEVVDLVSADVDGDFDLDLIVAFRTSFGSLVRLFRNAGGLQLDSDFDAFPMIVSPRRKLAVGDLDHDGDIDVVSTGDDGISLLENDGSGSFSLVGGRPAFAHLALRELFVTDVDGDSIVDLVILGMPPARAVEVLRNDGAFSFTPLPMPVHSADSAIVSDVDLDGDMDLMVSREDTGLTLLQNDGSSNFVAIPVQVSGVSIGDLLELHDAADLNGDGLEELALLGRASGGVALRGVSPTSWTSMPAPPYYAPQFDDDVRDFATGDVDGDGSLDLVVRRLTGTMLFLNRGSNWDAIECSLPDLGQGFRLADLDGDGRADLVAETGQFSSLGNGFGARRQWPIGTAGHVYLTFDADFDGDQDVLLGPALILLTNDGAGMFSIDRTAAFFQQLAASAETVVAFDADGDGDVDLAFARSPAGLPTALYLNGGASGFTDSSASLPITASSYLFLRAADVDRDGDVDVLVSWNKNAAIYENVGSGQFRRRADLGFAKIQTAPGANDYQFQTVQLADLGSNGGLEALVGYYSYQRGAPLVWYMAVFTLTGEETVLDAAVPRGSSGFLQLLALDFDGDADEDLMFVLASPRMQLILGRNGQRGLEVVGAAQPGSAFTCELSECPDQLAAPRHALVLVDTAVRPAPLPGIGLAWIDPGTAVRLPVRIPAPSGRVEITIPAIAGATEVHVQCLYFDDAGVPVAVSPLVSVE